QEFMLTAYRRLRQQKPEWLSSYMVTYVLTELKRAGRTDDEEKLYREAVAAADRATPLREALSLAATRGDGDTALALFDRIAKLPPAGRNAPPVIAQTPTYLSSLMLKRAEAKAHTDLLRIFETYL